MIYQKTIIITIYLLWSKVIKKKKIRYLYFFIRISGTKN